MQDIIKVLTGAWAMTDAWAYDILIKATIRAGHIMTNFPHLKPREHNLLTLYVNGVANTSVLGCKNSRDGDQWKQKGGPIWEDMTVTNRWLKWDLKWVQSIGRKHQNTHSLHFKQCHDICRSCGSALSDKATCSKCFGFPGKLEATCELGWTLQPSKSRSNTSLVLSMSYHGFSSAGASVSSTTTAISSSALNNTAWGMSGNVTVLSYSKRHWEEGICADTVTLKYT